MIGNNNDSEDLVAKWLAGELTNEEQKAFEASSEGQEYLSILSSADKIAFPEYDVESELAKLHTKTSQSHKEAKVVKFPLIRYAAAAVILVGIALVYWLTLPNYTIYTTERGETLLVELPDGSTVNMSANSEVKFIADSYAEDRLIKLEGEAFFDVIKGANFQVETDEGNIKVLGTTFNVDQRNEVLNVICFTGKVNVFNKNTSADLLPGDAIRIINGLKARSWKVIGEEQPAWMNGVTEIHEANLQVAAEALQNVFDIEIESNIELSEIPFDGAFPHNNIDIALRTVLGTGDIDYTYQKAQNRLSITKK